MESWDDLPGDLLETISEKLCHTDLLEVGAVCKSWRLTYLDLCSRLPKNIPLSICRPRPFGVPLLLLSCEKDSVSRKYVTLNDESKRGELFLPELANKWICGSSWGWLITTDICGQEISLLNPITRNKIMLPSLATFSKRKNRNGLLDDAELDCFQYMYKAIISHNPTTSQQNCVVMAIVGNMRQLSFCKIGDEKWTNVEGSPPTLEDVIYSEGRFYTATQFGVVLSYDGKNPNSDIIVIAKSPGLEYHYTLKYLVVLSGRLLQICRRYESKIESEIEVDEDDSFTNVSKKTITFDIFELMKRESPIISEVFPHSWVKFRGKREIWHDWVAVDDIGNHVLLLGNNGSLCLQSGMYNNCIGNCIHFTDHHFDMHVGQVLGHFRNPNGMHHDIGTFDITKTSIRNYHPNDKHHDIPSVWFTPNPW